MQGMGQRVVVVVGMHRGGTSLVTRGLKALGVELGENLMPAAPENPTGFWEDLQLYQLNERLLASMGRNWDSIAPIRNESWDLPSLQDLRLEALEAVKTRFGNFALWGFKDPRTSRLLPFWQSLLKHLGVVESYVLVIRNPISVARSLNTRNQFAYEKSYLLWLQHCVEAYTHTCGRPRIVVDYDVLMDNPVEQLRRISDKLELPLDSKVEEAIKDFSGGFLEADLRHSVFRPADVTLDIHASELVSTLYDLLRKVALDQVDVDSEEVQSVVATTRLRLQEFGAFFLHSERLEAERNSSRLELNETRSKSTELATEVARLTRAIADNEVEYALKLADRERQHAATASELQRTGAELQLTLARYETLRSDNQVLAVRTESLNAERESLRAENQALAAATESLKAESESLRVENQALAAAKESLRAENQALAAATESLKAESDSLRAENRDLAARAQLQDYGAALLRSELHNLWNSRSWRLFRPLRNFLRRRRGFGDETEPILRSEPQLIQTIVTIRQSLSWELTTPLRLFYRIFPRGRRSTSSGGVPTLQSRNRDVSEQAVPTSQQLNGSPASSLEDPLPPQARPLSSPILASAPSSHKLGNDEATAVETHCDRQRRQT